MNSQVLIDRTKRFALQIITVADSLPSRQSAEIIARQIIKSATSVSANYRAACRAQSPAEFIAKMHTVHEEADETQHWLELLFESGWISQGQHEPLKKEASELTAIFTASFATARKNKMSKIK